MILLLKIFSLVLLISLTFLPGRAQDDIQFVRLTTYWDAPGIIQEISPLSDFIIISDSTTGLTRLVEIATGDIVTEQPRNDVIYFSSDGHYVSIYDVMSGNTQILDLKSRKITYEARTGIILIRFSTDSQRGRVDFHPEDRSDHSQVIEIESGNVLIDVPGINAQISPDGRFIGITDPLTQTVNIYAVDSGETALQWQLTDYDEGEILASSIFSPDGNLLVIYQHHNFAGYVFETGTWEKRYEITGYPNFSTTGRYITSNRHANYSHVYLYEAATGRLIDEVDGDMYLDIEEELLFRREARAPGDNGGTTRIIDLSSDETLFDVSSEGYDSISVSVVANNTLVRIYRQIFDLNYVPVTTYLDLRSGEVVKEIIGEPNLVDTERGLLIVNGLRNQGQAGQKLVDWDSGETYITENMMDISPDRRFIVTSNGLFVDVYGAPGDHLDTMPPPRSDSGIGMTETGDIPVYMQPDSAEPMIESTLNQLVFSVMGQTVDGEWLYGTYLLGEHREGWIKSEQLSVVKPWDNVPILDPADPLASLYEIAVSD